MLKKNFDKHLCVTYEDGYDAVQIMLNPSFPDGYYCSKYNPESDMFYKRTDDKGRVLIGFDAIHNTIQGGYVGTPHGLVFNPECQNTSSVAEEYISKNVDLLDGYNWILYHHEFYSDGNSTFWYVLIEQFREELKK